MFKLIRISPYKLNLIQDGFHRQGRLRVFSWRLQRLIARNLLVLYRVGILSPRSDVKPFLIPTQSTCKEHAINGSAPVTQTTHTRGAAGHYSCHRPLGK